MSDAEIQVYMRAGVPVFVPAEGHACVRACVRIPVPEYQYSYICIEMPSAWLTLAINPSRPNL